MTNKLISGSAALVLACGLLLPNVAAADNILRRFTRSQWRRDARGGGKKPRSTGADTRSTP